MNDSLKKFLHPLFTAKGEERAYVDLQELKTLWFNTGSLCNLSCQNCYIESSPRNDRLAFITEKDVSIYLEEVMLNKWPVDLIGLTGGEPFANPHIMGILHLILSKGFNVLLLTNAYKVISKHHDALLDLNHLYPNLLKIRISLDHYTQEVHEKERGVNTFRESLKNLKCLVDHDFNVSLAGRSLVQESSEDVLAGYQALLDEEHISLTLVEGDNIIIFPEMDEKHNVPEISTKCWDILKKSPTDQMCASQRMIIKRKGEQHPVVMPCTLLAYDQQFELGDHLAQAKERVYLNHPFCAKFCVLGGASCSA